jgi:hypothetical protein
LPLKRLNYEKLSEYFLDMVNWYKYLSLPNQKIYLAPIKERFPCKLFQKSTIQASEYVADLEYFLKKVSNFDHGPKKGQ